MVWCQENHGPCAPGCFDEHPLLEDEDDNASVLHELEDEDHPEMGVITLFFERRVERLERKVMCARTYEGPYLGPI